MFIIVVVDVIIVNCNGRRNNLEKFFQMYEKKICFFSILIILIIIAILIYNFLLMPNIRLKGSRFVELDYLDKYVEEGYSAYFLHDDITDKVVVKNNINSKKLGNYEVEYMVNVGGFKRKVVRKVKITDKTAPVIKLDSDDTVYVCPGEKFSRDKFTACILRWFGALPNTASIFTREPMETFPFPLHQRYKDDVLTPVKYDNFSFDNPL